MVYLVHGTPNPPCTPSIYIPPEEKKRKEKVKNKRCMYYVSRNKGVWESLVYMVDMVYGENHGQFA